MIGPELQVKPILFPEHARSQVKGGHTKYQNVS